MSVFSSCSHVPASSRMGGLAAVWLPALNHVRILQGCCGKTWLMNCTGPTAALAYECLQPCYLHNAYEHFQTCLVRRPEPQPHSRAGW